MADISNLPQVALDAAAGFGEAVDRKAAFVAQIAQAATGLKSGAFTGEEQVAAKSVGQKPQGIEGPSV